MEERACAVCGAALVGRSVRAVVCGGACKQRRWRSAHPKPETPRPVVDQAERHAKKKAYKREWYQANKVRLRQKNAEASRRWRAQNIAKARESDRRSYAAHRKDRLAADKAWRVANPEKAKETWRRSYERNRDRIAERARQLRELNPERARKKRQRYYEANREVIGERRREYYARNRDRLRADMRHRASIRYWGHPQVAEIAHLITQIKEELRNGY